MVARPARQWRAGTLPPPLGVRGGFTYDAAEAVAAATPDTLLSLLDKSLVRRSRRRVAVLDARDDSRVRRRAADRGGRGGDVRRRHAEHYLASRGRISMPSARDRSGTTSSFRSATHARGARVGARDARAPPRAGSSSRSRTSGRRALPRRASSGRPGCCGTIRRRRTWSHEPCGFGAACRTPSGAGRLERALGPRRWRYYRRLGDERGAAILLHVLQHRDPAGGRRSRPGAGRAEPRQLTGAPAPFQKARRRRCPRSRGWPGRGGLDGALELLSEAVASRRGRLPLVANGCARANPARRLCELGVSTKLAQSVTQAFVMSRR